MRFVRSLGVRGFMLALIAVACAHCGSVKGAGRIGSGPDAGDLDNALVDASDTDGDSDASTNASTTDGGVADSGGPAIVVGSGGDTCATATPIAFDLLNPRHDLMASTLGGTHDIDAPCSAEQGADTFYKFAVSKRVFVYADTFGASWDTVLFLLSDTCVPMTTTTTPGDAVCNDNGCGTQQSRIVALLEPGAYRLGLAGRGSAQGAATIHFEWAIAGSGAAAQLPDVDSVQTGTTSGLGGNIDGLSNDCLAAGAENSYWWARCPSDPAKTLHASTCGGTTWESVLETQIPKSAPGTPSAYRCNLDACGLQSSLTTAIPAGAGLGVLSVDGQGGSDIGHYSMTVTYTP